jgi:hypothetical protein
MCVKPCSSSWAIVGSGVSTGTPYTRERTENKIEVRALGAGGAVAGAHSSPVGIRAHGRLREWLYVGRN